MYKTKSILTFSLHLETEEMSMLFSVFNLEIWSSYFRRHFYWIRIFGRGVCWQNGRLGFRKRYGYKKYLKLGKWTIEYLPKIKNDSERIVKYKCL